MGNSNEIQSVSKHATLNDACYRNKITYLSFILAILVVIRHTSNIEVYGLTSGVLFWIEKFFAELTDLAVPTFFVLSGYLFFQNYTPKILLKKWKSRLFSLLIPYLIWNGISYLYILAISSIPNIRDRISNPIVSFSLFDFCKDLVLGENNFVTWFLRCLIVYTIVTPLIYWIIKNKYGAIISLVLLGVAITIINKQVLNYWIMYLLGACLGIHLKAFMTADFSPKIVICAFGYLLISVIIGVFFEEKQITIYTLLRLSQVIAIWIYTDCLAKETKPKWWMKISFFVYLCHNMVLESVEKGFLIVFGRNGIGALLDFIFAPIITLLIIIALAFVLRKIKPVWSILTGSRG